MVAREKNGFVQRTKWQIRMMHEEKDIDRNAEGVCMCVCASKISSLHNDNTMLMTTTTSKRNAVFCKSGKYTVEAVWNQRRTLHIIRMENTLNATHISYIFEYISTYSLSRSTKVKCARTTVRSFLSSFLHSCILSFSFALDCSALSSAEAAVWRFCFRPTLPTKWTEPNRMSSQESDNKNQSHHPKIYLAKLLYTRVAA